MTSRNFRGIPEIQEVECWGGNLEADVSLLTLKLFDVSDDTIVAFLKHFSSECTAYGEFASCAIDAADTRRSKLRVLVADLAENETRIYGCVASVLRGTETEKITWKLPITLSRKFTRILFLNVYPNSNICFSQATSVHNSFFEDCGKSKSMSSILDTSFQP